MPARSFYFQWHLTNRCNLRCRRCYQSAFDCADPLEEDDLRVARQFEQALCVWKRRGRVSLTGGEPFLVDSRLFRLLGFFDTSPSFEWIGILTNGTLIDDASVNRLKRYERLREVQVSLDGANESTHDAIRGPGAFARAIEAIERLVQGGIPIAIMFTLTSQNFREINEFLRLAGELKVNAITIERMVPAGSHCDKQLVPSKEIIKDVFVTVAQRKNRLLREHGVLVRTARPLWCLLGDELGGYCPAGLTSLCVMPDGTLLPCRRLEIPIGNVLKDGLLRYGTPPKSYGTFVCG
ncbi:MAG: radical SAM protein [Thermoguttaceae bacterium]|nr:radical SAM protein [Thermoguttaceae bacterium]MDW8077751.1 radical SAM protein [Thermoguttaceae bacterium]